MAVDERYPLKGRVAIVTGGSRGIGAATVEKLAAQGAAVTFTYKSSDAAAQQLVDFIRAKDGRAMAIRADQASFAEAQNVFEKTASEFGKPDILVVNAGITRDRSFKKMAPEEWAEVIQVNLTGAYNLCRLGVERMN